MAKWYTESQLIGKRGESLVELRVLEMGHLYNRIDMDAGIDGSIEIRDPVTKEATGQVIRVQSKATNNQFPKETDLGFEFTCRKADLDYWLSANTPVLLVVSRPRTGDAYWINVHDYFATPERRSARKVYFDKAKDRFDESASDRIIQLGRDRNAGLYINPIPRPETLVSNLLPVTRYPRHIYSAESRYRKPGEVIVKAKEMDVWLRGGWALWEGRLWSASDLSKHPWSSLCDPGTMETFAGEEWADSEDTDRRNIFVRILNGCLDDFLRKRRVRFDREMKHYHFMSPRDLSEVKIPYTTHKNRESPGITVFKKYEYGREKKRTYYRHHAFHGSFRQMGGCWYLRIDPTYRYTWNGRDVDPYYESHLSGMKKEEKNRSVLSNVELWAHVLSEGDGMFVYPNLGFGELLRVDLPVGIDDAVWKAKADADTDGDGAPTGQVEIVFGSAHREVEHEG